MGGKGSGRLENLGEHVGKGAKPKGVPNKLSRQAIKAAMATGELPAEGLLRIFRYHMAIADSLASRTTLTAEERAELKEALERARVAAKDAAPYYHARLTAHKVSGTLDLAEFDPKRLTDEQLYGLMDRIRGLVASLVESGDDDDDPEGARGRGEPEEDEEGGPLLEIPARPGSVHRE